MLMMNVEERSGKKTKRFVLVLFFGVEGQLAGTSQHDKKTARAFLAFAWTIAT